MVKLVAGAVILCPQLYKLGTIGDQLAGFGTQIDGVVGVHIWRLSCLEKQSGVSFMAVRGQPLAWAKKGALRAIGDEGTAQIYTAVSNKSKQKQLNNPHPFARSTKRSLEAGHC